MNTEPAWLSDLLAIINAQLETGDVDPFKVSLVVSGRPFGISLPSGRLVAHDPATAVLEGSESTFQQIVSGAITPQKAFLTGLLTCRGDPEAVLRTTMLFERCSGSLRQ